MSGTVLIVDGMAASRIVLAGRLANGCYHAVQSATGAEALRLARSEQPDILLTDLSLPDMTGVELCRLLRADPATRNLPVVCIDGGANGAMRCAALRAGADDILTRPLGDAMLLARLRSLMRAAELEEPPGLREGTRQALGLAEAPAPFPFPTAETGPQAGITARQTMVRPDSARAILDWRGPTPAPSRAASRKASGTSGGMPTPARGIRPARTGRSDDSGPGARMTASTSGPAPGDGRAPDIRSTPEARRLAPFVQDGTGAATGAGRIAIIAGDRARALRWKLKLAPFVQTEITIMSPSEALSLADESAAPDVFLAAITPDRPTDHRSRGGRWHGGRADGRQWNGGSADGRSAYGGSSDGGQSNAGLRLLSELRSRGATRRSAIICLLDRRDEGRAAMALDLGAADLVRDDFEPEETALRLNQHLRRKHAADRRRASLRDSLTLAVTDPLTGLHNRRYALANLASLTCRSDGSAEAGALAVFLLDLDGFKAVNDAWGHPAGDAVLVEVAQRLRQCLSPGDLVARIGGEEFLVARPSCTESTALDLAHALRLAVAAAPVQLEDRKAWVEVTLSVGVALADPDPAKRTALSDNHTATPDPETATRPGPEDAAARAATLIAQADRALLASKTGGRNRVTLYRRALSDPPGPIRSFGT